MINFKHPEDAMRARMLGVELDCARCVHWHMPWWCKLYTESPHERFPDLPTNTQCCDDFQLPPP